MEMRPDTLAEASLATLLEQLAAATERQVARARPPRRPAGRAAAPGRQRRAVPHRPGGAPECEPPFRSDARRGLCSTCPGPVVRLSVRDDGHGFDEAKVTPEHFGLAMMRERAEDAGVDVTVESAPGAGATVTAEWRRGDEGDDRGRRGAGARRREEDQGRHRRRPRAGAQRARGRARHVRRHRARRAGRRRRRGRASCAASCSRTSCSWTSSCPACRAWRPRGESSRRAPTPRSSRSPASPRRTSSARRCAPARSATS